MQELDRHQPQQAPTGPVVWILSKGEHHEGGNVLGVYADRDLARGQFVIEAQNMAFAIDDARQEGDGSVHLDAGCDWLALESHPLVTREELTAPRRYMDDHGDPLLDA